MQNMPTSHRRALSQIDLDVIHHDGVWFSAGDKNYNGTTVDEDIARMDADYRSANERLNLSPSRMPYHLMGGPNGRLYYTLDSRAIGAHALNNNTHTIGVCTFGNFVNQQPTLIAQAVVGGACAITFRGLFRKVSIKGHYEVVSTECPGDTWPLWDDTVKIIASRFAGF